VFGVRPSPRPIAALVTAVAALAASLVLVAPAQAAAPAAPVNLAPAGPSGTSIPTLSWDRVPDATVYDVQVAKDADFSNVIWSQISTWNDKATPSIQLPKGQLYWRVRAASPDGTSDWSNASFTRAANNPPTLLAPGNGDPLEQPRQTPAFQWSAVQGAQNYLVRVGQDPGFVDPSRYVTLNPVQANAATLSGLLAPGTYYWEVQAQFSNGDFNTDWSAPSSFTIGALPQAGRQAPADDIDGAIQDVVLDWTPVAGARTYDLQVSTDQNFNTTVLDQTLITGTRFSPATTLNNDQYYWRVRAVDAYGNRAPWGLAPVWRFKRNWPDQPTLQYPTDGAAVGDPFFYQWSAVPHASRYVVQLSTDAAFTDTGTNPLNCFTTQTTLTPGSPGQGCRPGAYGTYYWRVYAVDDPGNALTDYISAQVHSFTYEPDLPQPLSPVGGTSTSVPTMTWAPVAGATRYQVTWTDLTVGGSAVDFTDTTSYTPRSNLTVGHSYRWTVQSVAIDGSTGTSPTPPGQPTFTVADQPAATAIQPDPTGPEPHTKRFPTLTWQPVQGADHYVVYVRKTGSTGWNALLGGTPYFYPAAQDTGDQFSSAGPNSTSQRYDWYVDAYSGSNVIGTGAIGHYTIDPPTSISGFRAALTGIDTSGAEGTSCGAQLPNECQNLRQTPVLRWDANADVGFYKAYLTFDGINNAVPGLFGFVVNNTMWVDPASLPDSQAGSAYYWTVVPCTSPNVCAPVDHASHAFNKQSNQVVLTSPVTTDSQHPATVSNDVTLTWQDLLATETTAGTANTALTPPARTEAYQYRVQVSTTPDFTQVIDDATVDQTTYTCYANTYPEGTLYWRVRAIDASGNGLNWSDPASFQKSSPAPTLTYPVTTGGQMPQVNGTNPFSWDPLPFAASYDLEVYKNDDLIGQQGNRVLFVNTPVVAYAPSSLLPASSTPYTWRVRRVDAANRPGPWSPFQEFLSVGSSPTLVSPTNGSSQAPNGALFTWLPVTNAVMYKFERRLAGSSTVAETIFTQSTSWAEPNLIGSGTWQWRVTAMDGNGNPLGNAGNWSDMQFTVNGGVSPANNVSITGTGATGQILTLAAPTWNLPGVTTTYQWQRDGSPIFGQTGTSYTVAPEDVGHAVTVRATGTKPGYVDGTSVSNVITGGSGNAPSPLVAPSVSGGHHVGDTVSANPGTWPGTANYTYQWLRNGKPIAGATGAAYVLAPADATRPVSVRVTATISGYQPGNAASKPITVGKMRSTSAFSFAANPVFVHKHPSVTISVAVPGFLKPTGKVRVYDGKKKVLQTTTLKGKNNGLKTVRLPVLKKGKHKIKVVYLGSTTIKGSKTAAQVLVVTK
jgi:large repetitive protein